MKNMLSKLSLSLLILFFTLQNQKTVYAQNIKADIPASFNLVKSNKLKKATIINMPFIDRNLLIEEDSIANNSNFAVPFRFLGWRASPDACPHKSSTIENYLSWRASPDACPHKSSTIENH